MIDVVERLRASLRQHQGDSFNMGYEAGKKWAENTAAAQELERLEIFQSWLKRTGPEQPDWEGWFRSPGDVMPWLALVGVILDDKNIHPMTAQTFWKAVLGDQSQQPNDGDFLRGFVEGAVDLWAKVREQL